MTGMKTKRACGECTLCCKVMGVPQVKSRHEWCPHAIKGGGGCAIYRSRPEPCRAFHCMWLIDQRFGSHWFPAKSKIVVDAQLGREGSKVVCFIVDPSYPRRWLEEPWFSDIKTMARAGIEGKLGEKWTTVVMIKDECIPIVMGKPFKGRPEPQRAAI